MVCRDEIVEYQGWYTIVLIIASYKGSAAACKTSYHRLFRLLSLVWFTCLGVALLPPFGHSCSSHKWKPLMEKIMKPLDVLYM